MKIIASILAFIIFSQSLSVCGPRYTQHYDKKEVKQCKDDLLLRTDLKKHNCCSKNSKSDKSNDDDKGCGGDTCKCYCHTKVFIKELSITDELAITTQTFSENNILPVFVHSYDFHSSVSYPPQI